MGVFNYRSGVHGNSSIQGRDALIGYALTDVSMDGNAFIVKQSTILLNTDNEDSTISRNRGTVYTAANGNIPGDLDL
jgi:hypothetical protein